MKGWATGLLLLAVGGIFVRPAVAGELEDLRSRIDELQRTLDDDERENARQRLEEERQRSERRATLETLQRKLEALTGQAGEAAAERSGAAPPEKRFSKDRPDFLDRWLRPVGLSVPEREPPASDDRSKFVQETASGKYGDPTSFFLLHAYLTLTYADFGGGLDSIPDTTEQILIAGRSSRSGRHESGFKNDTALFIGSELTENLKGLFEIHFVGNARDPVLTESKIAWTPILTPPDWPSFRLVAGRYWWPFGIHSDEWMSAMNLFNLQSPAATEVVPAHYTELGVMAEGEWQFRRDFGINYLVSFGNGIPSFELDDNLQNTFDDNGNRTVTTRLGVFPGIPNLALGFSYAHGALRRGLDPDFSPDDARRFEADLTAYGADATYRLGDLRLRGYWYSSKEDLSGAPVDDLDRDGGTLEALYTFVKHAPILGELALKGRVSRAKDASLTNRAFRLFQYGFGMNAAPHEHFRLKAEYFLQDESGTQEVDNDGVSLSGTVEF